MAKVKVYCIYRWGKPKECGGRRHKSGSAFRHECRVPVKIPKDIYDSGNEKAIDNVINAAHNEHVCRRCGRTTKT